MTTDLVCRRFVVAGHVQGVFFRASTVREAARLGLRGWARNLADGRVEVLALGTPDGIASLATFLERGPPRARVTAVSVREESAAEFAGLADFQAG